MTAMRADYFGAKSFGTIMGFSSLIVMLGMSLGPVIAGYAADVTGDFCSASATCLCFRLGCDGFRRCEASAAASRVASPSIDR